MVLARRATRETPKRVASLIDLHNVTSTVREFVGQSQISHVDCFVRVWSYIKEHKLQDPNNRNIVNCDAKLSSICLGKPKIELGELPSIIKLHFGKPSK